MDGQGTYKWKNGDMYVGSWRKNLMHGEGRYFSKNGENYRGIWENQKLIKVKDKGEA